MGCPEILVPRNSTASNPVVLIDRRPFWEVRNEICQSKQGECANGDTCNPTEAKNPGKSSIERGTKHRGNKCPFGFWDSMDSQPSRIVHKKPSRICPSCTRINPVFNDGDTICYWCRRKVGTKGTSIKMLSNAEVANRNNRLRSSFRSDGTLPEWVSVQQFALDTKTLGSMLPPDVDAIVGVARSGLTPANAIATQLQLPILAIRQTLGDSIELGNGWRLGKRKHIVPRAQKVAIIDDTVMTGASLRAIAGVIKRDFPNSITAAVYVNPLAKTKPDLWVHDLGWPHLLEWNIFNSVLSPNVAMDFDGVLCHDCTREQDDDGPKYLDFIRNVRPLNLPRRVTVPLIVTARIEKYRSETMAWLDKWGVSCDELVMHPAATLAERNRDDIAAYKAKHFARWASSHTARVSQPILIESDDSQARRIASLTGRPVACPAAGNVYAGVGEIHEPSRVVVTSTPRIPDFAAVTSISPFAGKLARQQECLASWRNIGIRVIAMQLPGERQELQRNFPDVEFVEAKSRHEQGKNVLITELARMAETLNHPVMIINSDIEIQQSRADFIRQWVDVPARFLQYGNRWNHGCTPDLIKEPWGLDAFRVTPAMVRQLPDLGYALGLPMWDYWLPWHFVKRFGYQLRCDPRPVMLHRKHRLNWSRADHAKGCRVLLNNYGASKQQLDNWVAASKAIAERLGNAVINDTPGPRVIFDHLPKCAGSTVTTWLKEQFPLDQRWGSDWRDPYKSIGQFKSLPEDQRWLPRLISGHFVGRMVDHVHPAMLAIATVREPVDLILSYYYFIKQNPDHPEHGMANRMGIEGMLSATGTLRNPLVPYLAGMNRTLAEANPDKAVSSALERVKLFDVLGDQNDVPAFIEQVKRVSGLSLAYDGQRANQTDVRPSVNEISRTTRQAIESANQLDIELYRQVSTSDRG